MARIWAAIQGEPIPGRDWSYAGIAAYGCNPANVLLVIAKSANDNAVIYEYVRDARGPYIKTYWLSLEPSDRARLLALGNPSLFTALNYAEEAGYGVTMEVVGGRYLVSINAEALATRKMELVESEGGALILSGVVAGKPAQLTHAYLQMRRGLSTFDALSPRALEEVRLYALDLSDGPTRHQTLTERIVPT